MASARPRLRVLLICQDRMGARMAGPGIRYSRFAAGLAERHDVTLLLCQPPEVGFAIAGVDIVACGPDRQYDPRLVAALARDVDVVITEPIGIGTIGALARSSAKVIFDLYVPAYIESLSQQAGETLQLGAREAVYEKHRLQVSAALSVGDGFLCASQRQRDLWIGSLAALGRIDVATFIDEPSLDRFLASVPFGVERTPPAPSPTPVLRGAVNGIGVDDEILLWAGGVWNWFDPLTLIRAVDVVSRRRPSIRLFFMGIGHPSPLFPQMRMTGDALALADDLGLTGKFVFFNHDWIPYEDRAGYLLEADVGVCAHFRSLETDYSFRTRLLDHFWAGLPSIVTEGGVLSDLIEQRELGVTVPDRDIRAWADAIERVLDDRNGRKRMAANCVAVARELTWDRHIDRVDDVISTVTGGVTPPRRRISGMRLRYALASLRVHQVLHGTVSTIRHAHNLVRR